MKNEKEQNPHIDAEMEMTAKVISQVLGSILGYRASVALVNVAPSSECKSGIRPAPAKPMSQRAQRVRERIMRDSLIADFCEEQNNDMILLACAVETMERTFDQIFEGTMPVKTAKALFKDASGLKNEIIEKWLAFFSEEA